MTDQSYEEEFLTKCRELHAAIEKAKLVEATAKEEHKEAKLSREAAELELDDYLAADAKDLPLFGIAGRAKSHA